MISRKVFILQVINVNLARTQIMKEDTITWIVQIIGWNGMTGKGRHGVQRFWRDFM